MLKGKTVILGVCGGIAAYKAAALCSKLVQAGAKVRVVMTESAAKLVQPLTFQALSKYHVVVDAFEENDPSVITHVDMADSADLVIIAPATANIIGKMANGIADDMLSTTMLVTRAPVIIAPAMNVHMYDHPAVQANMRTLEQRGAYYVEPGVGLLACGYVGKGRLAEPEEIVAAAQQLLKRLADRPLAGKKVLVTAGGTVERIDPVRYLTNDSSGKMGFAVAEAARELGAEVTVVAARTSAPAPAGVELVRVESALEMREEVLSRSPVADMAVMAAAVADYRPLHPEEQKIKKNAETLTLELVKNPDILLELGERKNNGQLLIGFAAETENVEVNALGKLERKNCDLLVANDVSAEGAGFGTDTNIITIYGHRGFSLPLPLVSKREAALRLMRLAAEKLAEKTKGPAE
ncbi:bifunctional phosphopantothenoylcysteine decarboxylase/phosphopantothenate--cysteine ligase CoaBC [Paenibacillus sp. YN15]|uniref:bifunctional phosphopantothenoylcysteine decarboxylase/phosphopantothenate--cysteine ligase CoaBC n=1 Tax=Paenibacillus sp. YN15 TaxID=1742774 RepID=UPI000DCDF090|nr:bifunctional phosphopantothenoylcysteine decarboxylase/phosphopantothenate--cysteine ligase CoaBC [Paenibacillus sp. YN15]RAU92943.1 bifunctional phosphopantothenoylcysteine decarboxylase/phosphopantothenate--cysteine ligase CoaBC [Paenibacillus sp. YN15]